MDEILVRTLCGEEFTSFLTQLINFKTPRKLIVVKTGNLTQYQQILVEILKKKKWKVRFIDSVKGEANATIELCRYLVRNKVKRFFIVDDDVIFSEESLSLLKLIGFLLESYGISSYSIFYATREVQGFTYEILNTNPNELLIDFRPAYFVLDRNLENRDFEPLFKLYGSKEGNEKGLGYIYFTSLISKYLKKVVMVKSMKYGSWHIFRRDTREKKWKFMDVRNFDKMVINILKTTNPNYKLEVLDMTDLEGDD